MKNKQNASVAKLVLCSQMAAITVLLQISIGLLPGPGHILSAFGTLPVAIAAFIAPGPGIMCVLVSSWLTFILLPAELPIFVLCIAPLGLFIGLGLHYSLKPLFVVLVCTFILAAGMLSITFGFGMPAFGPFLVGERYSVLFVCYLGFSFIYSSAWYSFTCRVLTRLRRKGLPA